MPCDVQAEHIGPCGVDCLIYDFFAKEKQAEKPTTERPAMQQHFLVAIRHSGMPIEQQWRWVLDWAEEARVEAERLRALLRVAEKALRSYQNGNSAIDLAEEVADAIVTALAKGQFP